MHFDAPLGPRRALFRCRFVLTVRATTSATLGRELFSEICAFWSDVCVPVRFFPPRPHAGLELSLRVACVLPPRLPR